MLIHLPGLNPLFLLPLPLRNALQVLFLGVQALALPEVVLVLVFLGLVGVFEVVFFVVH